jgi:NhaP-type Na+/H+ or K+/H+ antiporter
VSFTGWLLIIGCLLLAMALGQPVIRRLPVTPAILYLLLGIGLGPLGLNVIRFDPVANSRWLHHAAEIGVIISLFSVGMKLRLPIGASRLRPALCLASISMVITVMLVAATGVMFLGLSMGEAILLGAILAPTDPVLASEVQIRNARDHDKVRLTLSAEAGLNDGTAFPFVMLGLGLLGLHNIGAGGWRWVTVDLLWAVVAGLAIGAALGHGLGKLMLRLHARRGKAVELGEYLVLGLIAVSYGAAVQVKAYGFLAVFAAGMALRAVERRASPSDEVLDQSMAAAADGRSDDVLARNPRTASAYFAGVLLATNELLEHLLEVGLVLMVGATVVTAGLAPEALWFAPLLFLLIRPLAVLPLLSFGRYSVKEFNAIAWFGIRGIGSLYYLMFAIDYGLTGESAIRLSSLTLTVVVLSILAHGISATPLFDYYSRSKKASPGGDKAGS